MYFNYIHIYLQLPNNINKYCRGQHNQSTNKNLNTDTKQEKLKYKKYQQSNLCKVAN